jgi:dystonin
MASLCADLDAALIQSQGVLDAMANLSNWLDLAENQLNTIQKPASLIPDRLEEQIRQLKLLEADVDSHEASIQKMFQVSISQNFLSPSMILWINTLLCLTMIKPFQPYLYLCIRPRVVS